MAQGSTMQFPTSGWEGMAPGVVLGGVLIGANMNSTADQAIQINSPALHYVIESIWVSNASISLTTAQGGFYTGAGKTGTTLVANTQAYSTLTAAAVDATGSSVAMTLAATGAQTTTLDVARIYFALTTAQGAAATANIRIYIRPYYR
jgi:hypothetical protein